MMRQPNCLLSCIVRTRFTLKKKQFIRSYRSKSSHLNVKILVFSFRMLSFPSMAWVWARVAPNTSILRYSQRYSLFGNFSLAKIFGLWSLEIFHKQRSLVFGICELLELNSTNIFLFDIQMNVWNKYIVLPSFLKSHFSTYWYS